MIVRRNPATVRWLGRALVTGEIPLGRTHRRMFALCRLLDLGIGTDDVVIEQELKTFKTGSRRG